MSEIEIYWKLGIVDMRFYFSMEKNRKIAMRIVDLATWTWQSGNTNIGDVELVIWECRLGTLDMKLGNVDLISLQIKVDL